MTDHRQLIPWVRAAGQIPLRAGVAHSPFGLCQLVWGEPGICSLVWLETPSKSICGPLSPRLICNSEWQRDDTQAEELARAIFSSAPSAPPPWVAGTPFQLMVWSALLKIPFGTTTTYSAIAQSIGQPKACRAVGSAVAANPVGFVIPCHRVLPRINPPGSFRWGSDRKAALIAWEMQLCHVRRPI